MKRFKFVTLHLFLEPWSWIFSCFFQPLRFRREVEVEDRRLRLQRMFRLTFPLFLGIFPFAILTHLLVTFLAPTIYHEYPQLNITDLGYLLVAALLALGVSVLVGTLFGLVYGIVGSIAGTFGIVVIVFDILISTAAIPIGVGMAACVAGMTGGVGIGSAGDIARSSKVEANIASAVGVLLGIPPGIVIGIIAGSLGKLIATLSMLPLSISTISTLSSAILSVLLAVLVILATLHLLRERRTTQVFSVRIDRGFSAAIVACIAASIIVGGITGSTTGNSARTDFIDSVSLYIAHSFLIVPILIISYELGYYRLPLYLASGWSSIKAYRASRKNPPQVFVYLHHCSLYWDECVFLPLPYLTSTLYLAIEQDIQQTLNEIAFIVRERPTQLTEARAAALEIALRDLEERETLRHIAQASESLARVLPQESRLIDPRWATSLARLNDVSREAARYLTLRGRQERRKTLDEMLLNLKRVPNRSYDYLLLRRRLELIVKRWSAVIEQELERISWAPQEFGYLDNPYISGAALGTQSQQFVGRYDLVRQLEQALHKGENRPYFFLTGERRMGKTSTLNQLPVLLGARCLPLIFDLQQRSISANIATFLFQISSEASRALDARGIRVPQLEYEVLNKARQENEALVYRYVDRWLSEVEAVLERRDRVLLLAFDEFEKLEEAGRTHSLDVPLLLDWFRSVIQHRPRVALLFSGVESPGEMDTHWVGHFVNVKILHVGFLQPAEARRLISRPVADYPGERIFDEGVVDQIISLTGCHPFLVQALCSELIDILNAGLRDQAQLGDVQVAVENVLESWGETYFRDLWERTDQEQRTCLRALRVLGKATMQQVHEYSHLDLPRTRQVLQTLCKRDLVRVDQDTYRLAVPIFSAWLEQAAD